MPNDILIQILWMFPVYSFLGWCLEVINAAAYRGKLSNRGFLNGCICPIYGAGAIVLVMLFSPIKDNLLLLFFGAAIAASAVELTVGYILKKSFHMTWWDYSDKKFNLGGYICIQSSLIWGVAGVMLLRVIHPTIYHAEISITPLIIKVLLVAFYIYFVIDVVITVLSILKFNRDLREITYLSNLIHKGSDAIADSIGSTTLETVDRIRQLDLAEKAKEHKQHVRQDFEDAHTKIQAKLEDVERLNVLLDKNAKAFARMIKALPKMKSLSNSGALSEVKRRVADLAQKK